MPIRSLSPKDAGRVMSEGPPKLAPLILQSQGEVFLTLISILFWILAPEGLPTRARVLKLDQ